MPFTEEPSFLKKKFVIGMYKPKQESLSHAPYQHLNLQLQPQHQPKPQTKLPQQQH